MNLALLAVAFLIFISIAYVSYGGWIARILRLNDHHKTPSHQKFDGIDFVPTKTFYLFGQHFSAIAAAGPIAGPIIACQLFGWGPSLLWIALGVVLIGAVHDFTSLLLSVRHGACSVAEAARESLGKPAGRAFMAFIWIALAYIIIAFADITAGSFVRGTEELEGLPANFNPGGAVAMASVSYLILATLMGLVQKFLNPPLWLLSIIFVPATFAMSYLGTEFSTLLLWDVKTWGLLIVGYCVVASLLPVWVLLQPRGYLGGFVLYASLLLGVIGVFFGGYEIKQDFFKGFEVGGATGSLFPFLFVTIACGACSGFHGLVCGGTTSKQIDKESDTRVIGYGAMLAEAFVGLIALVTIMILTTEEARGLKPGTIYGNALGNFLTLIIGKDHLAFAITFGAMAFSTFVFDTLDVAARLGRYIIQELFSWTSKKGAAVAALISLVLPAVALYFAQEGSWVSFWTLFGASNQLLAALTLLAVTVWLWKERRPIWFTLLPMCFVLIMTIWALLQIFWRSWSAGLSSPVNATNGIVALTLVVLALYLLAQALRERRG